jgi:hypothetical protein
VCGRTTQWTCSPSCRWRICRSHAHAVDALPAASSVVSYALKIAQHPAGCTGGAGERQEVREFGDGAARLTVSAPGRKGAGSNGRARDADLEDVAAKALPAHGDRVALNFQAKGNGVSTGSRTAGFLVSARDDVSPGGRRMYAERKLWSKLVSTWVAALSGRSLGDTNIGSRPTALGPRAPTGGNQSSRAPKPSVA